MAKEKITTLDILEYFYDKLKTIFSQIGHKHTISDLEDYMVDSKLSMSSVNPVENKVVTSVINELTEGVAYIEYDESATAALIDLLPKAEEVEF